MSNSDNKIWPMNADQSFFAAAGFVTMLVCIFILLAVGDRQLCWVNKNAGLALWIQAFGSIGAIGIAGFVVNKQIRFSKQQSYEARIRHESHLLFACLEVANEVDEFIRNTSHKLKENTLYGQDAHIAKINSLSEMLKGLIIKPPHSIAIAPLLTLINQLDNAKIEIIEFFDRKKNLVLYSHGYELTKNGNADERVKKTENARMRLSKIYRDHS